MTKKKSRINTTDPRSPQLFSNEELGMPPVEYEYRGTRMVTDKNGKRVRQAVIVRTKDSFVRAAREVWGDQNDYSESILTGMKEPITIRCRKHDHYYTVPFAQNHIKRPDGRLKPTGCPLCEAERIGYYPKNRGHHHLRTPEERERDEQEKARRRAEREQQKQERKSIAERQRHERQQRERDEQALIARWHAASIADARFKQRVYDMYGDSLDASWDTYKGVDTPIQMCCPKHGLFLITPRQLLNGDKRRKVNKIQPHGCWQCAGLPDPYQKQPLKAKDIYRRLDIIYRLSRAYRHPVLTFQRKRKITTDTRIAATCPRHGTLEHPLQWWLDGKGCEYCTGQAVYYPLWKEYARQVHGDKYEYVGEAPTTATDLIHYICKEHGLIEQRFDIHVSQGCGCKYCANRHIPLEDRIQNFISQCVEKYGPGRFDYSRVHEDYVNNDTPVWIRCCLHDKWFQTTPDNNLRTVHGSCPVCSVEYTESQGEAEIRRWLLKHGITDFEFDEHIIHHSNPRCKRQYLRPDFWFNDRPLVIEYHGEQHYGHVNIFNDEDWTFEDQQIRDATLRDWCRSHGRRLLEIPYWEFKNVPSILQSVLIDGNDIPTFEPPTDNAESITKAPTDA
jgi:hypothetical protein